MQLKIPIILLLHDGPHHCFVIHLPSETAFVPLIILHMTIEAKVNFSINTELPIWPSTIESPYLFGWSQSCLACSTLSCTPSYESSASGILSSSSEENKWNFISDRSSARYCSRVCNFSKHGHIH